MTEDGLIGKQLGEYRLEALLAQGSMARVYHALDVRRKRYVVVKVIDPPFHNDPDYIMRFEREAQAVARLDHPNIVRLYRFDEEDDWLYMAMQYIPGADLEAVLAGYRADKEFIAPDDARRIISEVGSALDYAHQKGVIHLDIKPANILLDRQGRAFLTDFGLAVLTESRTRGEIFGSPRYSAPEQAISSTKAVPQSDLYALGVILFEMFTGSVPFNAAEPLDIGFQHMSESPPAPRQMRSEITPELEAVILKALAKKPKDRYRTGAALAEALDRSLKARSAATATLLMPPSETIPESVARELDLQLFISYSHEDKAFVDKLEELLNEYHIRFWRDIHHATAGKLEKQINRAIRSNATLLLILSKNSIKSDWVQHEVRKGRELEKELGRDVLCPVSLDDSWKTSQWPERIMEQVTEYNILNFSAWEDESQFRNTFGKLIDGLNLYYKK